MRLVKALHEIALAKFLYVSAEMIAVARMFMTPGVMQLTVTDGELDRQLP